MRSSRRGPLKVRRVWTRHPATRIKESGKKYSRKKAKKEFGEREFLQKVWKTMKGQEKEDAAIGLLHERLEGTIRLIGLTGGIASGKSTVASFFQSAKIPAIDADAIAREVVRPKTKVFEDIVAAFGQGILRPDGSLDRERLGEIVFADDSKRTLLESITHPEILRGILKRVKELKKKKARVAVLDIPLLFESGLFQLLRKNILVRIDPEVQRKRLIERDHLSEVEAMQRILSQMPTAEKEKLADFVIDNSGTREETRRQTLEMIEKLTQR